MDNIYLREATISDCADLKDAFIRSAEFWQPWSYPPSDVEQYVSQQDVYLLCHDNDVIGTFSISGVSRGLFHSAYLGYNVFSPHQNKGYMSRGIQLLLTEAFVNLKLHRLEANIQPGNYPSIKLVSKAGFRKEGFSPKYLRIGGEWRDHERWAIVNDNWQPET